jgi:hypothetical protein
MALFVVVEDHSGGRRPPHVGGTCSMRHMNARRPGIGFLVTVAGALLLSASAGTAQSTPPSTGPDQAGGTVFTSKRSPYVVTLPAGWRVAPVTDDPTFNRDAFASANASVEVISRPRPGQTVEERVAAARADEVGPPCTSDPANDLSSTLDGEHAIVWSYRCPDVFKLLIQALHNGISFMLRVSVPPESEADALPILEEFRGAFQFVDAPASFGPPDLASIDAQLQGTWTTEWHPVELEVAAIEAAGLDPADAADAWWTSDGFGHTSRYGVKFDNGDFTLYVAGDGGPLEVGWFGTYEVTGANSFEATETGFFRQNLYEFVLRDDILTIDVISSPGGVVDMVPQTAIYETLPFTRVP